MTRKEQPTSDRSLGPGHIRGVEDELMKQMEKELSSSYKAN